MHKALAEQELINWVDCQFDRHGEQVRAMFNEQIRHGTALYDLHEKTSADIELWFDQKQSTGYPIIGIESAQGNLLGFASLARFRPQQATINTLEHSLYVHPTAQGRGIGTRLLDQIIERAYALNCHTLVGMIDDQNLTSIAMHKKAGFTEQGRLNQVAYKFDRWLDVVLMQRLLIVN